MADPVIVAQRRADATKKFQDEAAKLAGRMGVEGPRAVPHEMNRDPDLRKACELEVMADFLADLNAALDRPAAARAVKNAVAEEARSAADQPPPPPAPKPAAKATPATAASAKPAQPVPAPAAQQAPKK